MNTCFFSIKDIKKKGIHDHIITLDSANIHKTYSMSIIDPSIKRWDRLVVLTFDEGGARRANGGSAGP
jgi:hypothetical protein